MNTLEPIRLEYSNRFEYQNADGIPHRLDGPSVIYTGERKGDELWYQNGLLHRIGGPATIYNCKMCKCEEFGPKFHWFKKGLKHRLNAPAYIRQNDLPTYYEFGIEIFK